MWLEDVFKGGTEGIFTGVAKVIGTMKADPLEVLKVQQAVGMAELQFASAMSQAQTKINEIEAANPNKFVSYWRPAVGWICVTGLAYATLAYPLLTWACQNANAMPPPQLDTNLLMTLLTGLLGLAGYRTYEKVAGVTK